MTDDISPRLPWLSTVRSDLVEYFLVVAPHGTSLEPVAVALANLVHSATIRILDLVVVVRNRDDSVEILELDAVDSLEPLRATNIEVVGLLNDHDLEVLSFAVRPGTSGVVVVTEDRWAEPISMAAESAGGQIMAGERIPATRVRAVLRGGDPDD